LPEELFAMRHTLYLTALLALTGCATAPKPLQGEFDAETPRAQVAEGQRVRWGGTIIDVEPKAGETCIQVLGKPLAVNARPMFSDDSEGRFLACRQGFYDPAVFAEGREVTVTGTSDGTEVRPIGNYDYPLPRIAADVIYLWPERYSFDEP
jgi:outer membrane lipoprotein